MEAFVTALQEKNLDKVRRCPKADLHNHFVLGGSRDYLRRAAGVTIEPLRQPIASMDDMHAWNRANLGETFENPTGRRTLIRAAFRQAREDGVTVLEIGEDVWGLEEFSTATSMS